MGMAVRQDGSLLVAFAGTDEVWELPATLQGPPRITAGQDLDLITPHGVADLGAGFWAASSSAGGAIAVYHTQNGQNTPAAFAGVARADDTLAAGQPDSLERQALSLRTGERAFYESTRAGIACQSCHLHADTDYSQHDIGQRSLLPTLSVRGIAGTAPYLRDASFPSIGDLNDHLAMTLYRGYARELGNRRDALETYVKGLPRHVNPRWLIEHKPNRETAGLNAFVKADCLLCHTFPAFTNLSQHPVRAVFPDYGATQLPTNILDTPSLLSLHTKSHFLHDGRAHDLSAVFSTHNTQNRHGNVASLSAEEQAALIAFLETL
jgi:hypothetical protein